MEKHLYGGGGVEMHKLILCTTGTSVASGCRSLREAQGRMTHWDDTLPTFENELMDKIASIEYEDNPTARRRLSAELNTLDRIDLESGDRVVLISTDSAPGRVCSETLAGIIEEVYSVEVEIVRIEGMQVYDAKRLESSV